MRKVRQHSRPAREPLRLVKTWIPATLVRMMDETILSSEGAYQGRDDFIREAIADRIAEDRARPSDSRIPVILLRAGGEENKQFSKAEGGLAGKEHVDWNSAQIPTLPPTELRTGLYGLHNRDFPTLWAARSLTVMALSRSEPIPWSEYLRETLQAAWDMGAYLTKLDASRGVGELKTSIGFPSNDQNRQSSEARFVEHMIGVSERKGVPAGPLFSMHLAGTNAAAGQTLVAPTTACLELWKHLADEGFGVSGPPFSQGAWCAFRDHLRNALPEDFSAWMMVLRAISTGTSRQALIAMFSAEWPGAAASTNISGYVSRGREWGLVLPKLRAGKYALTSLGERESVGVDI